MRKTYEMSMALLLAIFLLTLSSYLDAQSSKVDIVWGGADSGYETWTVISATGGHLASGDTFTVERNITGKEGIKLRPSPPLRAKWGLADDVTLSIETTPSGDALCGFVSLETPAHSGMLYGHGQQHGILLKVQQPDRIKIIWSALPLAKGVPKDKKAKTDKCKDLEKLHHGGTAHARN